MCQLQTIFVLSFLDQNIVIVTVIILTTYYADPCHSFIHDFPSQMRTCAKVAAKELLN